MTTERILTEQEQKTNQETEQHIANVQKYIHIVVGTLIARGLVHDLSKLQDPELPLFVEYTKKLAKCTYGSSEYKTFLEGLKPALDHHYAKNRHHPEHYLNGINDMTLVDLIEMFCDWKAATLRHNDGNLLKSIEINSKRFNISEQLTHIFENTAKLFDQTEHEVKCGTLHPDGTVTNIRMIKQSDMLKCPHCIVMPDHYREDGTCKCDDPVEQAMMIKEWGYKSKDFKVKK